MKDRATVKIEQVDDHASELGYTKVNGKTEYLLLTDNGIVERRFVLNTCLKTVELFVHNKLVSCQDYNPKDLSVIKGQLRQLQKGKVCAGNSDEHFLNLTINSSVATVHQLPHPTIRHKDCSMLLPAGGERCKASQTYRGTLRKTLSKAKTTPGDPVSTSSKVPLSSLSQPQLVRRCRNLASQHRSDIKKIHQQRARLDEIIHQRGVTVSAEVDEVCSQTTGLEMMDPVKRLFLEQQLKQSSCKSSRGMRWHPTIIRWCLAMRCRSKSAYNHLKSTTVNLPCNSVLNDYAHYRDISSGIDFASISSVSADHPGADVAILCDEMRIKDGLVYEQHTGNLVGYTDIDINSALNRILEEKGIATHALVFMVRGLKSNIKLCAATYATTTATAEQIYIKFWELVGVLELYDLRVRIFISDGATTNRRFYSLHASDYPNDRITHRACNKYAPERDIYFASDAPHLIKTTRNNYENSGGHLNSRRLVLHGKPLLWSDVTSLLDKMILSPNNSFQMLHKLTQAHVKLTPFSRMKVLYATQVLSRSVANALRMKDSEKFSSAIEFIQKFNDAFDIFNIRYKTEGVEARNAFKMALQSTDDWRFGWVEQFLNWLDGWEKEVTSQPDLTDAERNRCLLSKPARDGWRITCHSFMSLARLLLEEGYSFILTEKLLCQDNLEHYFSHQRAGTGSRSAPSMSDFHQTARLITITQEAETAVS